LPINERPAAFDIARRAWISLFQAARQMPFLFLVGFALLFASSYAIQWLSGGELTLADKEWMKHPSGPPPNFWRQLPLYAFSGLIYGVILAPLAVAVHRFVLLGEVRKTPFFSNKVTLQFALLFAFFQLTQYFLILFMAGGIMANTLANLIYFCTVCWTLLVFPSLAVEEPSDNFARRLDTAIGRAKGRFWLILGSLLLTVFLLFLASMVAVAGPAFTHSAEIQNNPSAAIEAFRSWPFIAGSDMALIAMTALAAATASWLYGYATGKMPPDYAAR